jgi:pimeloyl-ACP methyl ester carboxylesterase
MKLFLKFLLILIVFFSTAHQVTLAQNAISFDFVDADVTEGKNIKLEAFEYLPLSWNGKVVLMSHGSTGGKTSAIKTSLKFFNISKEVTGSGYIFVTYMRKGRGNSEGTFTEESGRCNKNYLRKEQHEAELQIAQVIDQVKQKYKVSKLILMGHSRGGFLSATYAGKNPENVYAVVNLAGAWSAICETKNGGLGRIDLAESAKKFKKQFWAYFDQDSYFASDRFNDPEYIDLKSIADRNGLTFERYSNEGIANGHSTPVLKPYVWTKSVLPKLSALE